MEEEKAREVRGWGKDVKLTSMKCHSLEVGWL